MRRHQISSKKSLRVIIQCKEKWLKWLHWATIIWLNTSKFSNQLYVSSSPHNEALLIGLRPIHKRREKLSKLLFQKYFFTDTQFAPLNLHAFFFKINYVSKCFVNYYESLQRKFLCAFIISSCRYPAETRKNLVEECTSNHSGVPWDGRTPVWPSNRSLNWTTVRFFIDTEFY